jgi:hypothetical protein
MKMSTAQKLFGPSAVYFGVIDTIMPIALTHEYAFVPDEQFDAWIASKNITVEGYNLIIASELVNKAHLSAITALLRAKRWADATCLMHDNANFLGWAASARGLLESAGDTVDGLLNIALSLAQHHRGISRCLAGEERNNVVDLSALEAKLDHFVHAGWVRKKRGEDTERLERLKAKENADYVGLLEQAVPGTLKLYQKLCAICHPSNESTKYFYDLPRAHKGPAKLAPANDAKAIAAICEACPEALPHALMMSCNPPLYILRVLHKFGVHPKLPALRKVDWKASEMGAEIEQHLKN